MRVWLGGRNGKKTLNTTLGNISVARYPTNSIVLLLVSIFGSDHSNIFDFRWTMDEEDADMALNVLCVLFMTAIAMAPPSFIARRPRGANIDREKGCFWKISPVYTEEQFQRCFQMSRCASKKLVAELRLWISKNGPYEREAELAAHISGRSTQCEMLVPIFLRIMAGDVHDICALYGVAPST